MAGPIPCMGYPSRTAAVIALRSQGLTTRQIAERIGIEVKTVGALEASFSRADRVFKPKASRAGFPVHVDAETWLKLRDAARLRSLNTEFLAGQLLMIVADDGLVDAIVEDRENHMGEAA